MRIALFSGNYNYVREGANQALNRLVDHGEKHGHKFRIYSPVTDTPAFEPSGELVPVPSIALPVRKEFQLAPGLPTRIRDDVRDFRPDLVHVSTPDILGTRAQSFAKELGVPVVASLHTRFETYLRFYRLGWLRPLAEAHLRRFYRRSDHVLVPTAKIASEMAVVRGDDRVTVWGRGVDRTLFSPTRRDIEWRRGNGWNDDDIVVLFFGRLVAEKGVDDFITVVRQVQAQGVGVKPLVIGAGPAQKAFERLPDALLTGHLDGAQLARAVASADVLLHCSNTEAFGNVVLEAMASGVSILSSDSDSSRALIRNGRDGLLCPAGDMDCLVSELAELARDPRRRRELASAARSASATYGWEEACGTVLQAYSTSVGA
jgi:phosphatidylinositol alpha 1,6-mannosyltransferase